MKGPDHRERLIAPSDEGYRELEDHPSWMRLSFVKKIKWVKVIDRGIRLRERRIKKEKWKKNEDEILPAVDEFTRVFSQITQLKIVLYIYI